MVLEGCVGYYRTRSLLQILLIQGCVGYYRTKALLRILPFQGCVGYRTKALLRILPFQGCVGYYRTKPLLRILPFQGYVGYYRTKPLLRILPFHLFRPCTLAKAKMWIDFLWVSLSLSLLHYEMPLCMIVFLCSLLGMTAQTHTYSLVEFFW